jgi:phosphatidate phosphatase APP1
MDRRDQHPLWLNSGYLPVGIIFCPSEAAWKRMMKVLKCQGEPWPSDAATTHLFKSELGGTRIVVTLNPEHEAFTTRTQVAGLLCHEAVHVWQYIKRAIGEKKPGVEMEAYTVQAIFQELYATWLNLRGLNDETRKLQAAV